MVRKGRISPRSTHQPERRLEYDTVPRSNRPAFHLNCSGNRHPCGRASRSRSAPAGGVVSCAPYSRGWTATKRPPDWSGGRIGTCLGSFDVRVTGRAWEMLLMLRLGRSHEGTTAGRKCADSTLLEAAMEQGFAGSGFMICAMSWRRS
jgi:hypothetical protein